jgi:hypothetical protein
MDSSQPESSKVGQVGQVGPSRVVPVGSKGWDKGLYSSPVPPSLAPSPWQRFIGPRCPTSTTRKPKSLPEPWPPPEFCLPNLDTLEEISRGEHVEQRLLFVEQPDDSRAARLARILAGVPGVTTGSRMEATR